MQQITSRTQIMRHAQQKACVYDNTQTMQTNIRRCTQKRNRGTAQQIYYTLMFCFFISLHFSLLFF